MHRVYPMQRVELTSTSSIQVAGFLERQMRESNSQSVLFPLIRLPLQPTVSKKGASGSCSWDPGTANPQSRAHAALPGLQTPPSDVLGRGLVPSHFTLQLPRSERLLEPRRPRLPPFSISSVFLSY